jgi:broad specificity phosphatase PhoE
VPALYLVRHARPAATWGTAVDPGLDAVGYAQAQETALQLQRQLPVPLKLYTSPLKRCVETAQALATLWRVAATRLAAVSEIPAPPLSLDDRAQWLSTAMQGTWRQLQISAPNGAPDYSAWRAALLACLQAIPHDAVIYTHYIAINVAVGAAQGHDRVISFKPAHASVTLLDVTADTIAVRALGTDTGADTGLLLGAARS